jgi:hypothetical protein
MRRISTAVVAIVAVAAAVACTPKKQVEDVQLSPTVIVEINNNYNPPDQVTVYMFAQSGGRQVLGSVSPRQKVRFTYRPTNASEKFTLVAQATSGRKMTSQQFTLVNAVSLTWELLSNTMQFYEQ